MLYLLCHYSTLRSPRLYAIPGEGFLETGGNAVLAGGIDYGRWETQRIQRVRAGHLLLGMAQPFSSLRRKVKVPVDQLTQTCHG